tara:strand:+ start:270182 stop:270343 length:162 start_codon:yes stop_codon:yes gene_type:complete
MPLQLRRLTGPRVNMTVNVKSDAIQPLVYADLLAHPDQDITLWNIYSHMDSNC